MTEALDRVVEALRVGGLEPRPHGRGFKARCPVHDDHRPSLGVTAGDNGAALVFCQVCGAEATPRILAAVGLRMRDLFNDNGAAPAPGSSRAAQRSSSLPPAPPAPAPPRPRAVPASPRIVAEY